MLSNAEVLARGRPAANKRRADARAAQVQAVALELQQAPLPPAIEDRDRRIADLRERYSIRAIAIAAGLSAEAVRLAPLRVARRTQA